MRKIAVLLLVAATVACSREKTQAAAAAPPSVVRPATGTDVGDVLPAYSGKYLDGKPLDLSAQKGNVVFLNVWATWCGPCRYEIPQLQSLQEKYASRRFKVIGISVDQSGADSVAQFVKENKITYPIGLDSGGRIADVLHTTVLPTSVIIGRDGKVLWRSVGAMTPNDVPGVDALIERALQAKG